MTRRSRALIVGLVALVVVGVLLIAAELVARSIVADRVDAELRHAFALDAEHPLTSSVDGPLVVLQLAQGRLDRVRAEIPGVEAGSIRADVRVVAEGVALDARQPSERVEATVRIAESDVSRLLGAVGQAVVRDIQLVDSEVVLVTGFDVFGLGFELAAGVVPSIEGGVVSLEPSSLSLNGARVELADLRGQFGGVIDPIVDPLLAPRDVCIAEALPVGLDEQRVDVLERELVVIVSGENVALGGDDLGERGTCP
ncbi:DUF2993 domain-containing protein [Microcella sp.]|uniref:LmeA family phospholipid-binding protein n=1 Tax=Microcella sp. TaxID=1913979 RepID=UPI00391C65ED